jgi:hypothetical protein
LERRKGGYFIMRAVGILLGAITLMAGIGIIPEGIIGVFQYHSSLAELGKGIGNIVALLLIIFISYLLYSPDAFYRQHLRLIAAGGAIATIGGFGLIIAAFFYPAFQEASYGASFAATFAFLAGLLALADAAILFIRRRSVRLHHNDGF